MKTYLLTKTEFERVLHGNRAIEIQSAVAVHETVSFFCVDYISYSYPVQAQVKSIQTTHFKCTRAVRTSSFPFPIEIPSLYAYQRSRSDAVEHFRAMTSKSLKLAEIEAKQRLTDNEQKQARIAFHNYVLTYWLYTENQLLKQYELDYLNKYGKAYPINDESAPDLLDPSIEYKKRLIYLLKSLKN